METTDKAGGEPATYAFGVFRFAARERSLTGPDGSVRLTPKTADLLLALLNSAGHVVSKEQLIQQVVAGDVRRGYEPHFSSQPASQRPGRYRRISHLH